MPASRERPVEDATSNGEVLQHAAECAILLAMSNLRSRGLPPNSETVPAEATKFLKGSKPGLSTRVTNERARELIDEAVARMQATGQIYAPVQSSIFWRRLKG